jgi:SAM-dependent methyltransferase
MEPYPLEEKEVQGGYLTAYYRLLGDKFKWDLSATAWGNLSTAPKGYKAFVKKERKVIEEYLGESLKGTFCDVSGGAGNYSLHFSRKASLVVHCDLDVNSIEYAYERMRRCGLRDVLLVRCDYLQMPFESNVFDSIICIDTLERGLPHERRLLTEMMRCLKPCGKLVVDFHGRSRVPSFLVSESVRKGVVSYDRREIEEMLSELALDYKIKPIGYAPNQVPLETGYTFLDRILWLFFIPPSRWIVFGEKSGKN